MAKFRQRLFLYSPPTRKCYYICKWLKRTIFHDMWKWHKIQISVPINKVLLEPSHTRPRAYCLQLLLSHRAEGSCWSRGRTAGKQKVCRSALRRGGLPVHPALGDWQNFSRTEDPDTRAAADEEQRHFLSEWERRNNLFLENSNIFLGHILLRWLNNSHTQ